MELIGMNGTYSLAVLHKAGGVGFLKMLYLTLTQSQDWTKIRGATISHDVRNWVIFDGRQHLSA